MSNTTAVPLKILLSAYSCAPGEGSEPEAGLKVLATAASKHDVWLLFRADQQDRLEQWLKERGDLRPVVLVPVAVSGFKFTHNRFRSMSHYLRWQRALPAIARRLDSEVDFDLVHHATYATFYTPAGVEAVDKPMVWGPVGGADRVPVRLWRALGVKGILGEVSRFVAQTLLWAMSGSPHNASRRLVVLAQNRATANALNLAGVRIVPNATSVTVEAGFETTPGPRNRDVVMVARLIGWKGGWLAINAMRYVKLATRLRILGDGPDRRRLEKLVRRLRLGDRVEFTDRVPRDLVLKIVRHAGVILHPALRDEASLAVGEAMSLGTPVVLLDGTGAHGVAATWRDGFCAVKPKSARVTARALAAAIDASLDDPPPVLTSAHPSNLDFSKEILWAYQSAADHS